MYIKFLKAIKNKTNSLLIISNVNHLIQFILTAKDCTISLNDAVFLFSSFYVTQSESFAITNNTDNVNQQIDEIKINAQCGIKRNLFRYIVIDVIKHPHIIL